MATSEIPKVQPFSRLLSTAVINLTSKRDNENSVLYNDFLEWGNPKSDEYMVDLHERTERYRTAKAAIEEKWRADVLAACVNIVASLESTVERVLQLNAQIQTLRVLGEGQK